MEIRTNFTKRAGVLLQGEDGLYQFRYDTIPCAGDKLTVRTSPSEKVLTFVCTERSFNFCVKGKPSLELVFDTYDTE